MGKITLFTTGKLTATDDPRVKRGLLLPFGEPGRTNKGKLTASAGVLTIADQLDPFTLEHDPTKPIGTWLEVAETTAGLECSVRYLPTTAGNDALAEFEEGVRTGVSIEIDDLARSGKGPTIRDGKLVDGLVTGGSQVVNPAFMSARLAAAEDVNTPDQGDAPAPPAATDPSTPTVTVDGEAVSTSLVEAIAITTTTTKKESTPMTASATKVLATVQAPNLIPQNKLLASRTDVVAMLTEYARTHDSKLLAALADIVPANTLGMELPQFVGELWSGKAYERKIVPLFNHADLTSFKVAGWRWKTKPAVGLYTGNKAAIPSAAVETEAVDVDAQRIAGGHDIDRKYRDFSMQSFWEAYFAAMTESYAKISDAFVLAEVLDAAPYAAPGAVPAGVSKALTYVVDGILAIINATDTMPDSAVLSTDLWRELVLTRNEDSLAYLDAAVGLEEGTLAQRRFTIKPMAALAADTAMVACRAAATVHELGGEAPIRVEALDIAKGGIDEGVFGYAAVNIHDADGLALVSATDPNA